MPTDIVNGFSDDQIAVLGCVVSLIATGTIMSLSYYIGSNRRNESSPADAPVIRFSQPEPALSDESDAAERRDAA